MHEILAKNSAPKKIATGIFVAALGFSSSCAVSSSGNIQSEWAPMISAAASGPLPPLPEEISVVKEELPRISTAQGILEDGRTIPILGYGNTPYTFRTNMYGSARDIPISDVSNIEGSVLENVRQSPYLGIRNDYANLMKEMHNVGASYVRISSFFARNEKPFLAAEQNNLRVLYVYDPKDENSLQQMREQMPHVLEKHPIWKMEILNEPDLSPYWQDFSRSAVVVKEVYSMVKRVRPETGIVIGALADESNIEKLIAALKKEEVPLDDVEFAVHGYHDPSILYKKIMLVQRATGRPVIVTEVGVDNRDTEKMRNNTLGHLLTLAVLTTQNPVFIHQGPEHTDEMTNEKYGLFTDVSGKYKRLKNYFISKYWSQKENIALYGILLGRK